MIVAGGMGSPGGLIVSYGYGGVIQVTALLPLKAIRLISADPSALKLMSADPSASVLISANPSARVLRGRVEPC